MNYTSNGQGMIYIDGWSDTFALFINDNGFTEFYITLNYVTLIGFNKDLQASSVVIV